MAALAEVEFWTAGDGTRLALRRHPARGTPRGAVILVHGFGEHAGRYGHVAEWLALRGLAVFAADLGSLIEVVNRFGSYFYGSILGVFLLAMIPRTRGSGAFYGLLGGMGAVAAVNYFLPSVAFLWYNVIGAVAVMTVGMLFGRTPREATA